MERETLRVRSREITSVVLWFFIRARSHNGEREVIPVRGGEPKAFVDVEARRRGAKKRGRRGEEEKKAAFVPTLSGHTVVCHFFSFHRLSTPALSRPRSSPHFPAAPFLLRHGR